MKSMRNVVVMLAVLALVGSVAAACTEDSNSGTGNTNNNNNQPSAGSLFGDTGKGGSGGTNGVSSKGGAASVFSSSTKSSSGSTGGTVERGTTDSSSCTTACTKIIACYGGFEETEQADCEMGCAEAAVFSELECVLAAEQGTDMDAACTTMFDTCFAYDSEDLGEIDVEDGELATDAQCSEACGALASACVDLFGELTQADIDECVSGCAGVAPVGEVLCLSASAAAGCEYAFEACFGYEDDEFAEIEDEFVDDTSGSTSGDTSGSTSGDTSGSTSGDTSGTTTGVTEAECSAFCGKVMECDPTVAMEDCQLGCDFLTSDMVDCAVSASCEDVETVCLQ